jgi:2-polyprenyl-3-methyl-5-hydroxy-6-metoxy-1,4-benzoquinol methylase
MSDNQGYKTEESHWDAVWQERVSPRLPSGLHVGILNIMRLLRKHVRPGDRYVELGCAPGKLLAWVATELKADVSGLDYSDVGIRQCRALFKALNLGASFHQDDVFANHLPRASFDVVTSFGLIEHFDDATGIVQSHLDLVKAGGLALITVPNYGGVFGSLQRWCDEPNLALHNLDIMKPAALEALVTSRNVGSVRAYPFGVVSPWIVNLEKRVPRLLATSLSLGVNAVGLLQPMTIDALAPMLVLEVRKAPD